MGKSPDQLLELTMSTITKASKLPLVRVDREAFLRSTFTGHAQIEQIIAEGPPAVFTPEELRQRAQTLIKSATNKTATTSFLAGLPSNPLTAIAAGGADITQYFAFALNLGQQIAYLFGEEALFSDKSAELTEESKFRLISYLGGMFGAAGAASLISKVSAQASKTLAKRVMTTALTKTTWYPLLKRVGALIGVKITKKTLSSTVSKTIPILGGVVSGALTFFTFKPMGERLADDFVKVLNQDLVEDPRWYDEVLEGEFQEMLEDQPD